MAYARGCQWNGVETVNYSDIHQPKPGTLTGRGVSLLPEYQYQNVKVLVFLGFSFNQTSHTAVMPLSPRTCGGASGAVTVAALKPGACTLGSGIQLGSPALEVNLFSDHYQPSPVLPDPLQIMAPPLVSGLWRATAGSEHLLTIQR